MRSTLTWLFWFLTVLPAAVVSADTMQDATARLASDVKQFLDGKQATTVSIGSFQGRTEASHSDGVGIKRAFEEALKSKGIDVKLRATFSIVGSFEPVEDAGSQQQALKLTVEVQEKNAPPRTFERIVLNQAQVAEFTGRAVGFDPSNSSSQNKQNLKDAIDNPQAAVVGSVIKANNGQPFAIEILVAPDANRKKDVPTPLEAYRPSQAKVDEGFAFTSIARNQVYGVRLINRAPFAAAVALKIDGLSMFAAAAKKGPKGELPFTHLIVEPGESKAIVVKGWFITDVKSEEFLVTGYAESLAGSLNATSDIGTITATFHAAWPKGTDPPSDERKSGDKNSQGGDATGRGAAFEQKYVPAEMEVGNPRAVVPVRYTR